LEISDWWFSYLYIFNKNLRVKAIPKYSHLPVRRLLGWSVDRFIGRCRWIAMFVVPGNSA